MDCGCNFFDTAWSYGNGHSDALLGKVLAQNRDRRLYAASKVPPMNGRWPARPEYKYSEVFPARHVFEHVELIRRNLGVDAIDLLQFHVWDDSWADEAEFRDTIEKLKSDGLILSFGLSLNRWQPETCLRALRTGLVDVVQVVYNIFDQAPEDRLFPLCRELDIGVIARVPLDEGSLTGALTLDTKFPEDDWRAGYFNSRNLADTVARIEKLRDLLPDSMTLAELALRFILSNPDVSTTIAGMRKLKHVEQNLRLSDAGPLDPGLIKRLRQHRWDRGRNASR
jgi:aryl-alcohol dehydrogenase-like predicted oxidoreductase